jgi:putative ABC transport system ATP-binding protein
MIQDLLQEKGGQHIAHENDVHIIVSNVRFSYVNQDVAVDGLSFELPPRSTMAILAKTGSGKSTIAELLVGLKTPDAGYIQYNKVDIRQYDIEALRQKVGYVRKLEILEDTIANNIRFGRTNISVTQITEVLGKLGILEIVLKFDKNIDTPLSHIGVPLSYTQSKLICLARSIIESPSLLVIDGLLDDFDKATLDLVMQLLTAKDRTWSLVIFTKHSYIANYCEKLMKLDHDDSWELHA